MPKRPWKSYRPLKGRAYVPKWKKTGKGRRYTIKHIPEPKIRMFTIGKESHLLASTYSFSFFDDSKDIKDIEFNSKVFCFNSELKKKWEIKSTNLECFLLVEILSEKYLIIGTTKGKILLLKADSGQLIADLKRDSCVNDMKYDSELNILITCHDNGSISAYFLG